jgi:(2Fe-2S) ferredoxin
MGQYEKHVFVCTSGKECSAQGSADTFACLKQAARDAGISNRVRINHSGCTGQCGHGPMVVVYPQDYWYHGVDVAKAKRIFDEHLISGVPVEEFHYIAPPGENKLPKKEPAPAP